MLWLERFVALVIGATIAVAVLFAGQLALVMSFVAVPMFLRPWLMFAGYPILLIGGLIVGWRFAKRTSKTPLTLWWTPAYLAIWIVFGAVAFYLSLSIPGNSL